MSVVLLMSSTLMVTSLSAEAWAIPGPGMNREESQLELPDIPESEPIGQDESAETNLTTADEIPVVPYEPQAVTPWQADSGTADLTGLEPGATVPVADLPVALGVPEDGDPAALAGQWGVALAAPETSQDAGVSGLIMQVTPPATADPEAEVALSVDYTAFADLYGPQAADRFGLMLLPECVYTSPGSGDCAPDAGGEGTETMSAPAPGQDTFEALPSEVELLPAKAAPTRTTAAKNVSTRRIVTGTVPVGQLLDEPDASATDADGASARSRTGKGSSADAGSSSVRPAALRAAASSGSRVVGALDTGASAAGNYTATPLLSSGSWSAGSSSGAFTYSYQVQTPETGGSLTPQIGLNYSSQGVDGRTSATNNQASWIGDGWEYGAGAITRTYAGCTPGLQEAGLEQRHPPDRRPVLGFPERDAVPRRHDHRTRLGRDRGDLGHRQR
ncbi:Sugar-binding protein OS=Streptomyces microflavus OX=1919 GN=G3I39_18555 PE=4 SV=1 [Streptomyces microflavus]